MQTMTLPAGQISNLSNVAQQAIQQALVAIDAARATPQTPAGTNEALRVAREQLVAAQAQAYLVPQLQTQVLDQQKQVRTYQVLAGVAGVAFLGAMAYALRR